MSYRTKTIKETPYSLRPREKLKTFGATKLTQEELLAIILSSGIKGRNILSLTKEIYRKFPGLEVSEPQKLSTIKGLGEVKVLQIQALIEFAKRHGQLANQLLVLDHPSKVYTLLSDYKDLKQEHFILLSLNYHYELVSKKVITVGTISSSLFHPREVFYEAIQQHASYIIIAHNHPTGSLTPSRNDIAVTEQVKEAGYILGIKLTDSVIISSRGYRSILN